MGRALIFAHFDPHGIVDNYVLHALACYRQYFELVHFVTTSPLDRAQTASVASLVDKVIVRSNIGYDFMSWRVGFEALPKHARFDDVVFANDSCYGPCSDLSVSWARVAKLDADLWGASLNHQFRPHVQSFFMGFGRRLLQSGFARRFWQTVDVIPDKMQLIFAYEVGLSARVEAEGYRIGGVVAFPRLSKAFKRRVTADNASTTDAAWAAEAAEYIRQEQVLNPVQLCWAEALRTGLPFVKVELLRDNPLHANIHAVHDMIKAARWYDVQLISRHLERTVHAGRFPPTDHTNGPLRRGPTTGSLTPPAIPAA